MATLILRLRLGLALFRMPSATYKARRLAVPEPQLRCGHLTSSAWAGWWDEEDLVPTL
jgi:hypothetical protein